MIPVQINFNGKDYKGSYKVEKGIISVYYDFYHKNTQLGGHGQSPELLAQMILREIIKDNNL